MKDSCIAANNTVPFCRYAAGMVCIRQASCGPSTNVLVRTYGFLINLIPIILPFKMYFKYHHYYTLVIIITEIIRIQFDGTRFDHTSTGTSSCLCNILEPDHNTQYTTLLITTKNHSRDFQQPVQYIVVGIIKKNLIA